jgi:hypothetical protein
MRNKYFLKLVIALSALPIMLLTQAVSATECASVSFSSSEVNGKKVILELLGSNGIAVPQPKKYQKILKGSHEYLLAPGMHTLILNQWDKSDFSAYHKNLRRKRKVANPPTPIKKTANIQITADLHYQLALSETTSGTIIEIKEQKSSKCSGKYIASAKINAPRVIAENLPKAIEKQINTIMASITTYHKKTADKRDDTNVISRKLNGYFGTVLAKSFSDNSMKVNKIIPNTLAAQIGLKTGDLITKVGGNEIDTAGKTPSQAKPLIVI